MELVDVIEKRRATRSLEGTSIDEKTVLQLADAAKLSPSCYNHQPWRFIFVKEEKTLKDLLPVLSDGNAWAKSASMIIVVYSKKEYDCQLPGNRNYYQFDTGMATAFLLLKATELDLIAHPIAGFNPGQVKKIFALDEEHEVITLIIVGKKAGQFNPVLKENQIKSEKERPARKEWNDFITIK